MYRILLLIGLLTSFVGFAAPISCSENQCIAVIDAGNTGSRLHIYHYALNASSGTLEVEPVFSKAIEPGLASIELSQKSVTQYLSQLFVDVPGMDIPVYFYATSGMRMLSFARQQAYYTKLNKWFSSQPQWKLVVAKTLKSQEEALYGWIAVNYKLGTLTSSNPMVGVVDTGSASVQVAFPIESTHAIKPEDIVNIEVYGRPVSLFTHGFLGLGQDEIRTQYLDTGVCFPKHYPLLNGTTATGDFQACTRLIEPLVNEVHQVKDFVQPAIRHNSSQTWYIIGGISAMLQETPFTFENNTFTNQELAEKANRLVCQQDWAVLGTLYPENRHLFASCLNSSYFYSLFVNGLNFSHHQPIHYIPKNTGANDWTLGVVLFHEGSLKHQESV